MNMKKYGVYLSFILCIIALSQLILACSSKDLTKPKAKKILEEKMNEPEYAKLPAGFVVASSMPGSFEEFTGMAVKSASPSVYKELAQKGMINLYSLGYVMLGEQYFVSFPEEIKKKYVKSIEPGETVNINDETYTKDTSQILLANLQVGDITGITQPNTKEGQTVSYVEFNLIVNKTPFGEVMLPEYLQTSPVPFKAKFVLYDDGWRVTDKVLPAKFWNMAGE